MENDKGYPEISTKLQDFRVFLILAWRSLGLPDPTPVQIDMAYWFQHGSRRKMIQAFRGVGKSWIASAYVMWRLRLNPDDKFLVVSAGKERADNFTTFCMRLMDEVAVLQCLRPGRDKRNSKVSFDVAGVIADHAPSVKSVGIFGQLTGTRADEIIADDVETPSNSLTQTSQDRLAEAVKEFDAIIKPNGRITYLGTPQTELSIYSILPERGYSLRIWPARYPTVEQVEIYGGKLAPKIINALSGDPTLVGQPVDPKRFTSEDLAERELSYGRAGFALQFMLDTSLSDINKYPLKLSDLVVMDLDIGEAPEKIKWEKSELTCLSRLPSVGLNGDCYYKPGEVSSVKQPYNQRVIAIDPSGRGKDETAYAVLYERDGYLFLMDSGGLQGGYSNDVLEFLADLSQKYKVNTVLIESNFGDGMFKELLSPVLLRKNVKAAIEEVRQSAMKEARIIETLEPVISGHRLIVERKVIENDFHNLKSYPADSRHRYMLFYQMAHITKEKGAIAQDDRIDALSMAVSYFTESMRQDADLKAKRRNEKLLELELETFSSENRFKRNKETIEALGMTPSCTTVWEKGRIHISRPRAGGNADIRNRSK